MSRLLTLTIATLISLSAYTQGLTFRSYVEKTSIGNKFGSAVGYVFRTGVEVGGFYQEAARFLNTNEQTSIYYEKQFAGLYVNYPLQQWQKAGVDLNIRTGVSNGENFVITPSVLGHYQIMRYFKLGAGLGVRAFRPTLQGSLTIDISK